MKITSISAQRKNPSRVNISVDGTYRFSLDIAQVVELGLKNGQEIDDEQLINFEQESEFGKLYARTLEYCLMRPHSAKEIRNYLWKKTLQKKVKNKKTGEILDKKGIPTDITDRVFERLKQKGYIDDEKFARFWVENRNQRKGSSIRKLKNELRAKNVENTIIETIITQSHRNDTDELQKIIKKKQSKYSDEKKFTQYLMRQGFRYDDICDALAQER
jgi:regulatory protein